MGVGLGLGLSLSLTAFFNASCMALSMSSLRSFRAAVSVDANRSFDFGEGGAVGFMFGRLIYKLRSKSSYILSAAAK